MEPATGRETRGKLASFIAALAFSYALSVTIVLLAATRLFESEGNQRTILAWLILPISVTFLSWLAVRAGQPFMRVFVWLMVLAHLFFCWLSIFSIGVYYLPAPLIMIASALSSWQGESERT